MADHPFGAEQTGAEVHACTCRFVATFTLAAAFLRTEAPHAVPVDAAFHVHGASQGDLHVEARDQAPTEVDIAEGIVWAGDIFVVLAVSVVVFTVTGFGSPWHEADADVILAGPTGIGAWVVDQIAAARWDDRDIVVYKSVTIIVESVADLEVLLFTGRRALSPGAAGAALLTDTVVR